MAIDQVHDTQFVFREVLQTMSRPGTIQSLHTLKGKNIYEVPVFEATLLTIMTLFDAEVSFHILSKDSKQISEKITALTLAKETKIEDADYLIALHDATETEMKDALTRCKKGSLVDPHQSATWIVETSFEEEHSIYLTGPGIKNEEILHSSLSNDFWRMRNHVVSEYPLGVDIIFTDINMQVSSLPRTTNVKIVEVK